jgi:hypothetical protein
MSTLPPEDAVESYVGAYLDFLGHDQNFVRLIQREALGDGSRVADFLANQSTTPSQHLLRPPKRRASHPNASYSTSPRSRGTSSRMSRPFYRPSE